MVPLRNQLEAHPDPRFNPRYGFIRGRPWWPISPSSDGFTLSGYPLWHPKVAPFTSCSIRGSNSGYSADSDINCHDSKLVMLNALELLA